MLNCSTKFMKSLSVTVLSLLFATTPLFPADKTADWSQPLKICWEVDPTADFGIDASDNEFNFSFYPETISNKTNKTNETNNSLILFGRNSIRSLSKSTGKLIWEIKDLENIVGVWSISETALIFLTGEETRNSAYQVISADTKSGLTNWKKSFANIKEFLVVKNSIILLDKDNIISEIASEDGNIRKQKQVGGKFISKSSFGGGLFFLDADGRIRLIKADFDETTVDVDNYAELQLMEIVPGKNFYITASVGGLISAREEFASRKLWKRKLGGQVSGLGIYENNLFVASFDNFIYLFDVRNGDILQKKRLDGRVTDGFAQFDKILAVSVYNSKILTLMDLKSAKIINSFTLSDAYLFFEKFVLFQDFLIAKTPRKILGLSPVCQ
jgi:outer membrane protein assembly factor BamB